MKMVQLPLLSLNKVIFVIELEINFSYPEADWGPGETKSLGLVVCTLDGHPIA